VHAELERPAVLAASRAPAPTGSLPLIGRDLELQRITAAFDHAEGGFGSVLLLLGEAGIGKTRLAREAVREARARGFGCAWGSGWPDGDAAPLWPWSSIVDQLGGAEELKRLIREGDSERFSQFRAVAGAIEAAASVQPVLIVLDDAHTADLGALLLARFVARAMSAASVVFLLTARERNGTHADRDLALDDIARDAVVLRPAPLVRAALGDLLRSIGRTVGAAQLAELHELTGGNPLLIHELAIGTPASEVASAATVRSVLDRRLDHFDATQREILAAAAVLGPFATIPTIARVLSNGGTQVPPPLPGRSDRVEHLVTSGVRAGEAAGIVAEGPDGVVVFTHQLLAEALLASLSERLRAGLHERAADALDDPSVRRGTDRLAAIGRHRLAAAATAGADSQRLATADAACRAAATALVAEFAYESASALLAQVVELHDAHGPGAPASLVLQLAGAELAAGRLRAARPWFRRAADTASDDAELAEAAVGLGGIWVHEHRRTVDHAAFMSLVERAIAGLERGDVERPDLLVRLRVRRAAERIYTGYADPDGLDGEVAAARLLGDPAALAECLSLLHHTMLGPAHVADRRAVADELVSVAAAAGGDLHALLGVMWRTIDFVLAGDDRADRALSELGERADALQVAAVSFVARAIEVMRLIRAGRLDDAEAAAERCFAFGTEIGDADAVGYFGAHLLTIRWLQGREIDILPLAREVAASPDLVEGDVTFAAALAVVAAGSGEREEAATALVRALRRADRTVKYSSNWLVSMFCATETAAVLGDRESLATLYDLVVPHAALPVMGSVGVVCLGSAERILGVAALGMGHVDDAVTHFAAALRQNRQLANRPMVAITTGDLGCALIRRGRAGDTEAGLRHVATACDALDELGLGHRAVAVRAQAERLIQQVPPIGELIHRGESWQLVHGTVRVNLTDSIGLQRLVQLLQRPFTDVSAADLVGSVGETVQQPMLDRSALRAYRDRVQELRAEIDEAEADADLARAERLRGDLDALLDHLGASAGLGGRSRAFAAGGERARMAVRKSLRRVFDEVATGSPELGALLEASIRTGTMCRFEPVAGFAKIWRTHDPGS
jgi:hypothetical protein